MDLHVYERLRLPEGIKLEIVSEGSLYKGRLWIELARQIYCENGKDGFRDIGHFSSGAPFLYDADERISISHTDGCFVVATIPVAPDAKLGEFSPETALGVDVERRDREKALTLRDRFLSSEELERLKPSTVEACVTAWCAKEAMLKAGMDPAINWRDDIVIDALPTSDKPGAGHILLADTEGGKRRHDFRLTLHPLPSHLVVLASIIS